MDIQALATIDAKLKAGDWLTTDEVNWLIDKWALSSEHMGWGNGFHEWGLDLYLVQVDGLRYRLAKPGRYDRRDQVAQPVTGEAEGLFERLVTGTSTPWDARMLTERHGDDSDSKLRVMDDLPWHRHRKRVTLHGVTFEVTWYALNNSDYRFFEPRPTIVAQEWTTQDLYEDAVKGRPITYNGLKWLLAAADYEVTQAFPSYSAGMTRATLVFEDQLKLDVMMDGDRVVGPLNTKLWAFKEDPHLSDGFWMPPR